MANREVCLVTGGSRGIGAAIAARLAREDRVIFLNYRESREEALAVRDRCRGAGRIEPVQADVCEPEQVAAMMRAVGQETGRLDVLVHNAAPPLVPKRLMKLNWAGDVAPQIAVAALGFLNCMQAARPYLAAGSRIIVVLSDALFHTPPVQMGAYLAAKGALWGLVRAAAKELQAQGIRINTVSPSMTNTALLRNYPERALEVAGSEHPMGALAEPGDVAAAVEQLLGDAGRYMHGANIIVNGGSSY